MTPNLLRSLSTPLLVVTLLLMPIQIQGDVAQEFDKEPTKSNTHGSTTIDTPTWKLNDRWVYDGELDVYDFIVASGVSTNVNTLTGTLDVQVDSIIETQVGDIQTMAYSVIGTGDYRADNVQLEGQPGDVVVELATTSIIRVSDMSVISQTATIDIEFDPDFGWICFFISCDIASITASNVYWPPLERHDFPLSVGDTWVNNYTVNTTYSGNSNYVTIPQSTSQQVETTSAVVQAGYPGVTQTGCSVSYNVTTTDVNGSVVGYGWHCDSVKNDVVTLNEVTLGLMAEHEIRYTDLVARTFEIDVHPEFPLAPYNFESPVWVNVTDNNGNPASGQSMIVRFDATGSVHNITTELNGSAYMVLDYGSSEDHSLVEGEYGSHGITARISNTDNIGISTITLDPDIYEVDLELSSTSISLERNRDGHSEVISTPFDAIPGDIITFRVPLVNNGLRDSPEGSIIAMYGNEVIDSKAFPSLSSLETNVSHFQWLVPDTIGNELVSFSIQTNADDGNTANDVTEVFVYVGRMPSSSLIAPLSATTLTDVPIDASSSFDPDGGEITCRIEAEMPDGNFQTMEGCYNTQNWSDDGRFEIRLILTDDEGDIVQENTYVDILNQPPEISISPLENGIVIGEQVTLTLESYGDVDSITSTNPVSILWGEDCLEGRISTSCTFTPQSEGAVSASVTATDDDGAVTSANTTIQVLNAPPVIEHIHVWLGPNRISEDFRGLYTVNEGDTLRFTAKVEDSPNDMLTITGIWRPDADSIQGTIVPDSGPDFEVEHVYNTSGFHLLAFEAFDDNGDSTGIVTVPVEVINTPPTIDPISPPLPAFEDSIISITVSVRDTPYDLENIQICWDLDLAKDSSGSGVLNDDCDFEGAAFDFAWGESTLAPNSIRVHATDDDGSMVAVEIPLTVKNKAPVAYGSVSDPQPTEGDQVIFTAEGSEDTPSDTPFLSYAWDLDITSDSDGDGNPANDRDMGGYSIQTSFSGDGKRIVRLMVNDGTQVSTWDIEVKVNPAPQPVGVIIASGIALISILVLIIKITLGKRKVSGYEISGKRQSSGKKNTTLTPKEPEIIQREYVNDDPIRESMEELAEKLYGSNDTSSSRKKGDEIEELSRSLREELND